MDVDVEAEVLDVDTDVEVLAEVLLVDTDVLVEEVDREVEVDRFRGRYWPCRPTVALS